MDADYGQNRDQDGRVVQTLEQSLFVLTTVMSHPTASRAVVDTGFKARSVDSACRPSWPVFQGPAHTAHPTSTGSSSSTGRRRCRSDRRFRLIPGHCDPTVNLHDWFVCFRGERVEAVWPITARGAFY